MDSTEATNAVLDAIEDAGLGYMLVGSFSTNAYGVVRSTKDADIVVEFSSVSIDAIVARLPPTIKLDPQIRFESVTGTTRYLFDVDDIPFQIELFKLSDDTHDQERFTRRLQGSATQLNRVTFFPTAEDVLITKLRWALNAGRDKDRSDIAAVLAVQGERLDFEYIHRWCAEHGTRELLDEIRESLPPLDDFE